MVEKRIFTNPSDWETVVDTRHITTSDKVRNEVEEYIRAGRLKIERDRVFFSDPVLAMFSARDTYEVNLDGGYVSIEPPDNVFGPPIITPINLEPLAYLRKLADWEWPVDRQA